MSLTFTLPPMELRYSDVWNYLMDDGMMPLNLSPPSRKDTWHQPGSFLFWRPNQSTRLLQVHRWTDGSFSVNVPSLSILPDVRAAFGLVRHLAEKYGTTNITLNGEPTSPDALEQTCNDAWLSNHLTSTFQQIWQAACHGSQGGLPRPTQAASRDIFLSQSLVEHLGPHATYEDVAPFLRSAIFSEPAAQWQAIMTVTQGQGEIRESFAEWRFIYVPIDAPNPERTVLIGLEWLQHQPPSEFNTVFPTSVSFDKVDPNTDLELPIQSCYEAFVHISQRYQSHHDEDVVHSFPAEEFLGAAMSENDNAGDDTESPQRKEASSPLESVDTPTFMAWTDLSEKQRSRWIKCLRWSEQPLPHVRGPLSERHIWKLSGWIKFILFFVILSGAGNFALDLLSFYSGPAEHFTLLYTSWVTLIFYAVFFGWVTRFVLLKWRKRYACNTPFISGSYLFSTAIIEATSEGLGIYPLIGRTLNTTVRPVSDSMFDESVFWIFHEADRDFVFEIDSPERIHNLVKNMEADRLHIVEGPAEGDLELAAAYDPLVMTLLADTLEKSEHDVSKPWFPTPMPSWLKRPLLTTLALSLIVAFGYSFFRDRHFDNAFFRSIKTESQARNYLRVGGKHRDQIYNEVIPKIRLQEAMSTNTVTAYREFLKTKPPQKFAKQARAQIHKLYLGALERFKSQASRRNPQLLPFIQRLLAHLETANSPYVRVTFQAPTEEALQRMDKTLQKRKKQMLKLQPLLKKLERASHRRHRRYRNRRHRKKMLQRLQALAQRYKKIEFVPVAPHFTREVNKTREEVIGSILLQSFQSIFPSDVLRLFGRNVAPPYRGESVPRNAPTLRVKYNIHPTHRRYSSRRNPNRVFVGIQIRFLITFQIPKAAQPLRLSLTVDPPDRFSVRSFVSARKHNMNVNALLKDPRIKRALRENLNLSQPKLYALMARFAQRYKKNSLDGQSVDADSVYNKMATLAFQQLIRKLRESFFAPGSHAFRSFRR